MSLPDSTERFAGLEPARSAALPSGSRVVWLPMPEAPLVCIDLWCQAGSAFEGPGESGMAHFLEHMVFKGSEQLGSGDFDLRIEALGGSSNAATGFDDVHYHVLVPPDALAEAVALLLDLVLQPRLDCDDFDMERQVVLEELAQSRDQPDELALQTLLELGCGDHPYGRAILGVETALNSHTPGAMRQFQEGVYRGERCVLAVCGPLDEADWQALLAQLAHSPLGRLPRQSTASEPPLLQIQPGLHRQGFAQLESARLLMAWSLPGAAQRDVLAAMDLATSLLAEGRRSRLVARLREQLQLVESIDLDLQVLEFGSLALLEAVCDPEDLPAVRQEITTVLQEGPQHPPEGAELARGLALVRNGYRFSLEAAPGIAAVIGNNGLWNRPLDLAEPLNSINRIDQRALHSSLLLLQPGRACVLEAVPA